MGIQYSKDELMPVKTGITQVVMPNAFSLDREVKVVPHGTSIHDMVFATGIPEIYYPYVVVLVGEDVVPMSYWKFVKPKPNAVVTVRVYPGKGGGGGGGKGGGFGQLIGMVFMIASIAFAGPLGGALLGTELASTTLFTLGEFTLTLGKLVGGMIISAVGMLVQMAIAPPPDNANRDLSTSGYGGSALSAPTFSITGVQNKLNQYGPIPRVFGRRRIFPPLAGRAYTEAQGKDQYLRVLLCAGYGPLEISDIRIGNTPISAFQGLEYEVRQGYVTDDPITLYTNTIREEGVSVALTSAGGPRMLTTSYACDEISVDISFPRGLAYYAAGGTRQNAKVDITVEYSVAGANSWQTPVWQNSSDAGMGVNGTITCEDASSSPVKFSGRWKVPTQGRYDVRITRATADQTSTQYVDTCAWTAIRSIQYKNPCNQKGLALIALRIKAYEQLNNEIQQISCLAESLLPVYNGSIWTYTKTANPAWAYTDILRRRGPDTLIADDRLDLPAFMDWAAACDATAPQGGKTFEFNAVIEGGTVIDALRSVAAHGRASFTMKNGKFSIVRDAPQSTPIQHFTPRNSWSYTGQKVFMDLPHALKVRWVNPDKDYQEDERIVYDDGYDANNATKFETIDMMGCTSTAQVWRDARYHIAVARLRPEVHSIYTDIENLRCTVGDRVQFAHDAIMIGLGFGRIAGLVTSGSDVTGYVLDTQVTGVNTKPYAIRVRKADGTSVYSSLATFNATTDTIMLATPIPVANAGAVDDLFMFGEANLESAPMIVRAIEPGPDLTAKLTLIDYSPAVYSADAGTIPPFDTYITFQSPAFRIIPADPIIDALASDESVLTRDAAGNLQAQIQIQFGTFPSGVNLPKTFHIEAKQSSEAQWRSYGVCAANSPTFYIGPVSQGVAYDVRVRSDLNGEVSAWTTVAGHTVIGTSSRPAPVTGFSANVVGSVTSFKWDANTELDIDHYKIKYSSALSGVTWASAVVVADQVYGTNITLPAQNGTYLIRAVDVNGLESSGDDVVVTNIASILSMNAIGTLIEEPNFTGVKVNTTVDTVAHALMLDAADHLSDWTSLSGVSRLLLGQHGFAPTGTYDFANTIDLGAVFTSRVNATLSVQGIDIDDVMSRWTDLSTLVSMTNTLPTDFDFLLEIATTNDGPGAPVWSAWSPVVVGDYTCRMMKFRCTLYSYKTSVTPKVSTLEVAIDMPDRVDGVRSVSVPNTGLVVNFSPKFYVTPSIGVTGQNLATGDYWTITSQTKSGFTVQFFNSSNVGVARTMDWLAKGYGYEVP